MYDTDSNLCFSLLISDFYRDRSITANMRLVIFVCKYSSTPPRSARNIRSQHDTRRYHSLDSTGFSRTPSFRHYGSLDYSRVASNCWAFPGQGVESDSSFSKRHNIVKPVRSWASSTTSWLTFDNSWHPVPESDHFEHDVLQRQFANALGYGQFLPTRWHR